VQTLAIDRTTNLAITNRSCSASYNRQERLTPVS